MTGAQVIVLLFIAVVAGLAFGALAGAARGGPGKYVRRCPRCNLAFFACCCCADPRAGAPNDPSEDLRRNSPAEAGGACGRPVGLASRAGAARSENGDPS